MAIYKYLAIGIIPLFMVACGDKDEDVQPEMGSMDDPIVESTELVETTEPDPDVAVPAAEPPDAVDYGPTDIVLAIADRDQLVRITLTPTSLTMKLSADTVAQLRSQVRSRDLKDDLKAAILASVTEVAISELVEVVDKQKETVQKHEIRYPLDAVNSIHYQSERLWIDLEDEKPLSFDDIKTADGRPVLTNFEASDAESFAAGFETLRTHLATLVSQ